MGPRQQRIVAVLAVIAACSSCAFSNIDLVRDTRIGFTAPRQGATVDLPLTVRWDITKPIGNTGQRVQFAVFVDRTVIKAGRNLRSIVPEDDQQCRREPTCPDAEYLARRGIYVVDEPEVMIPRLQPIGSSTREAHRISVVILLDGRRDGEGAFSRTVYLEREKRR